MLTISNFTSIQSVVLGNLTAFLPSMMKYKSSIQREVIPLYSPQELNDITVGRSNLSVIEKLTTLGKQHFISSDKSDSTLFCICMAIGTIIKEYDWGTEYVQQSRMCKLASKIG